MLEKISLLGLASDMARHAAHRQELTAQNVANADTPGFKARDVTDFQAEVGRGMAARTTHPDHIPFSTGSTSWNVVQVDAPADPNGNTVSLDREVLRSVEAERAHSRAVTIYQNSLDLLRSSLGRR